MDRLKEVVSIIKNNIEIIECTRFDYWIRLETPTIDYESEWFKFLEINYKDRFRMSGGFINIGMFRYLKTSNGTFGRITHYDKFDQEEIIKVICNF